MTVRQMALVGPGERQITQTAGYPLDASKMLPTADVVLLIASDDPGAMLYRYTAYGELSGDTWHGTVADAMEHARAEFGDALLEWTDIEDEVQDPHRHAIQVAADRLNGRGDW